MKLTRNKIKKYLDDGFKNTKYCKKVRGTNELEILKEMSVDDLDFMEILKSLLTQIKINYNSFKSNKNWTPSARQKSLLEILTDISNDITNNNEIKLKNNLLLHQYEDFYWQVWDYFDDYNNKNEELFQEEIEMIIPIIEKVLNA